MDQVTELESAILQRAVRLAEEYRKQARRSRDTILRETAERIHLREQREVLLAKAKGERAYRRKVQASELRLRAEMDHLRWNLVTGVHARLHERMRHFIEQEQAAYLVLLRDLIRQGASAIEREEVVVELNRHDHDHLQAQWGTWVAALNLGQRLTLHPEPLKSLGGAILRSSDNRIRYNNTIEGRLERLEERLHQTIIERLLPGDLTITSG